MASIEAISSALKLTDVKKSDLRKAFEDLCSHSSSLASFNLTWSELDHYFTSIQSQLQHKFEQLQSHAAQFQPDSPSLADPSLSRNNSAAITAPVAPQVTPRPALKAFCVAMDGRGLRRYLNDHPKERLALRKEIPGALLCASDPPALILDAMDGFFLPNSKGDKDPGVSAIRRNCIILLEELMDMKLEITSVVRESAGKLAIDWKGKMSTGRESPLEALGFLHLLATYGLGSEFDIGHILELFVGICQCRQAVKLCRALVISDKIPDLIKKLIAEGKQLLAVKLIFEFKLADEFPPVPLLKAYVIDSKNLAKKVRKDGNHSLQSLNEASSKEISALRQVIKYIEDHNLQFEYPKQSLEKRIEQLEKQKAERKRPAVAAASKQQQYAKTQQQNGSKRPRVVMPDAPAPVLMSVAGANSTVSPFQQSHLQPAGLLPDRSATYLTSSARPYGLVGPSSAADPYADSLVGLYGAPGSSMGFPGNSSPAGPQLYSTGSHMPSAYYNTPAPAAYGGYGLPPQYQPSYYPQ